MVDTAAKYYVRNDDTGDYLQSIAIGFRLNISPIVFTRYSARALTFENVEIARSVITFIGDVLDFELAESLIPVLVPEVIV